MLSPIKATLQDVADAMGVHRSTVSLALRDNPKIALATRIEIKKTAERLGYKTNPLVAALMQSRRAKAAPNRADIIAFVSSHPTRYGWQPQHHDRPDFFPGAQRRAADYGYQLEHFWYSEPGMTPKRFRQILVSRGIHGIILGRLPPEKNTLELEWDDFSAVALGMTLHEPKLHHVTENHFETSWRAMQECQDRGYRRVGFVFSGANDSPDVGNRWVGAYLLHQHQHRQKIVLPICPGAPADKTSFLDWFYQYRPDSLLVTHASPVLKWLESINFNVPQEVGLVELQDSPRGEVAGVHYDPAKIGAHAVEILIGLMHRHETGVPKEHHEILISGNWREGMTLPTQNIPTRRSA